jgi:hypothetical protein
VFNCGRHRPFVRRFRPPLHHTQSVEFPLAFIHGDPLLVRAGHHRSACTRASSPGCRVGIPALKQGLWAGKAHLKIALEYCPAPGPLRPRKGFTLIATCGEWGPIRKRPPASGSACWSVKAGRDTAHPRPRSSRAANKTPMPQAEFARVFCINPSSVLGRRAPAALRGGTTRIEQVARILPALAAAGLKPGAIVALKRRGM